MFKEMIQEFIDYRSLLMAFTVRNIQIKYKQTVMGFMWALFMPMIIVFSGVIIKIIMAKMSGRSVGMEEVAAVTVKSLPWAFFVGSLKFAVNSLVGNMELVKKIYFPREVFPISYVLGQLFDLAISSVVFIVVLCFVNIGASIYLLWLPVLLFLLILLTAGFSLFLSCANLFFRDVRYIVDVFLTFGIFFTPVFYEASMFGKYSTLLLLNPVGAILENIHHVVIFHQPPSYIWLAYSAVWSIGGFFGSWMFFHKMEPLFAEKI